MRYMICKGPRRAPSLARCSNHPINCSASLVIPRRRKAEVDHFADAVRAEEARHQHVAVGQVYLLALGLVEAGDLEEAPFLLVENRAKNAWRVEVRQAAPVDRTVHAHQRDRM